jgi:hypothetical protein
MSHTFLQNDSPHAFTAALFSCHFLFTKSDFAASGATSSRLIEQTAQFQNKSYEHSPKSRRIAANELDGTQEWTM